MLSRSRSTWACELKYYYANLGYADLCHAPRERVSWNIKGLSWPHERIGHAPRERVSWNEKFPTINTIFDVTLHVSVWVEIGVFAIFVKFFTSHAPRERVSWNMPLSIKLHFKSGSTWACELKWMSLNCLLRPRWSRSTWACELKFDVRFPNFATFWRHAPRERVSWNEKSAKTESDMNGHAPRERVSWNENGSVVKICKYVTLHVSVWVEISKIAMTTKSEVVTLHVSVWVEIFSNYTF